tara:strand:+ start:1421 stop:2302 length:882 start_codon:yes stop_codon:yes gene_type:complete
MSSTRNNQKRLQTEAPPVDNPETPTKEEQQTQGLSFSVPTEFVDLPSKGLYYPEGHPLHSVDTVEIRHMTAKEEDILASQSLIRKGIVLDRMLQSILVDKDIKIKDLLVGDKNALTIAARISGYGSEYTTRVSCPACGAAQEFDFDLDNHTTVGAAFNRDELNDSIEEVDFTDSNTFVMTLPKSGHQVELKMLTGEDETRLQKFQGKKGKNEDSSTLTDTLKSIIISVAGHRDRNSINGFVESMPAMDSRYLRKIYQKLVPNIDLTQEFSCNSCGHTQDLEVPVTTDFFWPRS